ncbi:MAG: class I SAM-dependent methyltransferase [Anaerolineae bacterium]
MPYNLADVVDSYDAKYATEKFRNGPSFYTLALRILNPLPGRKLLDIACGAGDLLYYACLRQMECTGIDISATAVNAARKRAPEAQVVVGNAEKLDFPDETFDYVTILGSLEHLNNPGNGLLEIRRVLKMGGQALILVPNAYYLPDLVWRVWRTGYGPNHQQIVERFAAKNEWRNYIESGGLKVQRIRRFNFQFPVTKGDINWYRQNPHRLLGLFAAPFIPFNLSHSFLYLCVKDPASLGIEYHPLTWPVPLRLVDGD